MYPITTSVMMDFPTLLEHIEKIRKFSQKTSLEEISKKPAAVREKIEQLESLHNQKAQDLQKELEVAVLALHGDTGKHYLLKTLAGLGLTSATPESLPGKENPPEQSGLYQNLLALCRLAWLFEKNGEPEDHANKLSILFPDEKAVIDYLTGCQRNQKSKYLVHDACLFELPPEDCDRTFWIKTANANNNMQNIAFQALLPYAKIIERMLNTQDRPDEKKLKDAQQKASKAAQAYKSRERKSTLNDADRQQRTADLKELGARQHEALIELAALCRALPLQKQNVQTLQALLELHKSDSSKGHSILNAHGISPDSIRDFYKLVRRNDDGAIPDILVDGTDIGHSGVYLKKLNVLDDAGAALAACLGKITRCCQYLGGAGNECVVHGITSPNGGFYVLCKGDAGNPGMEDTILAQSWVWKSQQGGLCLDSIETSKAADVKMVADMFHYLGIKLCNEVSPGQPRISQINTGAFSGISEEVGFSNHTVSSLTLIDPVSYRDSQVQLFLADSNKPYIFYDKTGSPALKNVIEQQTRVFFHPVIHSPGELKNNESLKQAISFAISYEHNHLLKLFEHIFDERCEELRTLIDANQKFYRKLNQGIIECVALPQEICMDISNKEGRTAWHLAVQNPETLSRLLSGFPGQQLSDALRKADNKGLTVFHVAAFYPESLKIILSKFPELSGELTRPELSGHTVLHLAAESPESLALILAHIPDEQLQDALRITENHHSTLLHLAAKHPKSLEVIFSRCSEIQLSDTLKITDRYRNTALHLAAGNPLSLKYILAKLPEAHLFEAIKTANSFGKTVLHLAEYNPGSLKCILSALGKDLFDALWIADNYGKTVLYLVAAYPGLLGYIFKRLTVEQVLHTLKTTDRFNRTILHHVTQYPRSLAVLLYSLPETLRSDALKMADSRGHTVLHYAEFYPDALRVIRLLCPEAFLSESPESAGPYTFFKQQPLSKTRSSESSSPVPGKK